MITSNLSSNTIFFTNSGQRSRALCATAGYKTPFFENYTPSSMSFRSTAI